MWNHEYMLILDIQPTQVFSFGLYHAENSSIIETYLSNNVSLDFDEKLCMPLSLFRRKISYH